MRRLRYILLIIILTIPFLFQALALQNRFIVIKSSGTTVSSPILPLSLNVAGHEFYNGEDDKVFLRGVGIAHHNDDATGWWSGPGEAFTEGRWETDLTLLTQRIDANLAAVKFWGGNVIRVFPAVNWWWIDNINPYQRYGEGPNQDLSYRDYFELLIQRAELQGVYVIFCPYELVSYREDFVGFGGLPVEGSPDSRGQAVLNDIYSGDPTFTEPMRRWWRSVTDRLGDYPNVIFEIWNEPDSVNRTSWFNHQIEMYKVIRQNTNNVILFMWQTAIVPTREEELRWIPDFHTQLRSNLTSEPINVAYDFHTYRYDWNLEWGTNASTILSQLSSPGWIPQTRSENVDVPVICGETGMGLDATNLEDEKVWWDGLLQAFNELDIGYVAYYWMPDNIGWQPEQGLLAADYWPAGQTSPNPSESGKIFLKNKP